MLLQTKREQCNVIRATCAPSACSGRAGDMETTPGSLSLLQLLLLCPLLTRALYVYDDSPAAGYVGDYPKKMPAHKMYFISNPNLKNMKLVNERAVDSYFRILRATPQAFPAAAARERSPPLERRAAAVTEPPPQHQHSAENTAYVPRNEPQQEHYRDNEKTTPGLNHSTRARDEELFKPSRNEYYRRHNVHEKHTVVSKSSNRGNRRPHRAHNVHQKMYLSQVRDKILHKAADKGDRSGRLARLLPGGAQTVLDKNVHSAKEYRKRNTIDKETIAQRIDEQNDYQLNSPSYMRLAEDAYDRDRGSRQLRQHAEGEEGLPVALFYRSSAEHEPPPPDARAALEEAAGGAYYRGSASSYVQLNVGRKPAPGPLL